MTKYKGIDEWKVALMWLAIAAIVWVIVLFLAPFSYANNVCQVHIWPNRKIEYINCTERQIKKHKVMQRLEIKRQRVGPGQGQRQFYYNSKGKKVYKDGRF